MGRGHRRRRNTDLPVAIVAVVVFIAYVWLLTRATEPLVRALWGVSGHHPRPYAAGLGLLVGLPGLLFTLPRALAPRRALIVPTVRSRRQASAGRRSHLRTDVLGVGALLLAQVPLPAPWSEGKKATIANVTMSGDVVEISHLFGTWSIALFASGIAAAVIAKVYGHASALRVIAIVLAVGAPVIAWVLITRAVLA